MRLKRVKIVVQGEGEFYHQVKEAFHRVTQAAQKSRKLSKAVPVVLPQYHRDGPHVYP